jgi:DNA-binding response OmpR family regulator
MRELLARIRALLRRVKIYDGKSGSGESLIEVNDLEIDLSRRKVTLGGTILDLGPKEFDLLTLLAENKGIVLSREQLLERVWGYEFIGGSRTVDVHVRWLRQKIENDPAKPQKLITVRAAGYKLEG